MPPSSELTATTRRLEDKLAEIRTICRLHACPTGSWEDLAELPARLSHDVGLRSDISEIVRSLQRIGIHLPDALEILVLAVGGNEAPRHTRQISEQLSLLGGFLSNIGRWPGVDSTPILAPGEVPANIHKFSRPQRPPTPINTPPPPSGVNFAEPSPADLPQPSSLIPPPPSVEDRRFLNHADVGSDTSDLAPGLADAPAPERPVILDDAPAHALPSAEISRALARLERGNLELRAHLESIDQRISRMEPLLEIGVSPLEADIAHPSSRASAIHPVPQPASSPETTSTPTAQPPPGRPPASIDPGPPSVAVYPVPRDHVYPDSPSVASFARGSHQPQPGPVRRPVATDTSSAFDGSPQLKAETTITPQPAPVVPRFSRFARDPEPDVFSLQDAQGSGDPNATYPDHHLQARPVEVPIPLHPASSNREAPPYNAARNTRVPAPAPGDTMSTHRGPAAWPIPPEPTASTLPDRSSPPSSIPSAAEFDLGSSSSLRPLPLPRGFFGTAPNDNLTATPDPASPAAPDVALARVSHRSTRVALAVSVVLLLCLAITAALYYLRTNATVPDDDPTSGSITSSPAPRTSGSTTGGTIATEGPLTSTPARVPTQQYRPSKNSNPANSRNTVVPVDPASNASSQIRGSEFRPAGTFVPASVMDGRLIAAPLPDQPRVAATSGLRGMVILEANISPTGQVEDVNILGGNSGLRSAAIGAVRNWRYRPYLVNGSPVEVRTIVRVDFSKHTSRPADTSQSMDTSPSPPQ